MRAFTVVCLALAAAVAAITLRYTLAPAPSAGWWP